MVLHVYLSDLVVREHFLDSNTLRDNDILSCTVKWQWKTTVLISRLSFLLLCNLQASNFLVRPGFEFTVTFNIVSHVKNATNNETNYYTCKRSIYHTPVVLAPVWCRATWDTPKLRQTLNGSLHNESTKLNFAPHAALQWQMDR